MDLFLNPSQGIDRSLYMSIKVHRDNILEDTLKQITNSSISFKKPLRVQFIGEPGVDEGGVRKEFF